MTKSLKDLIYSSLSGESWKMRLLAEWPQIVGNLANKTRVEKVQGKTLVIGVYEASWLHELYTLSSVLMKSINEYLEEDIIQTIHFKHATKRPTCKVEYKKMFVQQKTKPVILNSYEQQALTKIKDDDLKQALHSFLTRCHTRKLQK